MGQRRGRNEMYERVRWNRHECVTGYRCGEVLDMAETRVGLEVGER